MEKVTDTTLRNFSYVTGLGIPLILGLILPKLMGHEFRSWTLIIGVPILVFGIIKPNKLIYIYKGWMKIGHILGWFNSRLILGLVFFLVLQPISLIMKIIGYDPLCLKSKSKKTFKEYRKHTKIDLNRIF